MKKILAAAIAATLVAPAAFAGDNVTVYGNVHNSVDFVDGDNGDFADVVDRVSTLGFKGSEDLGNGTKAIFKIESQVGSAGNTTSWAGRNTYVGLAGDFGTVLVGRHDSPLKMSTGKLEVAGNELGDYEAIARMEDHRLPDVIAYISPSFSGLTFSAATAAGGDYGVAGEEDNIASGWAAAAVYRNAGIHASIAYEDSEDHSATGSIENLTRLGLGYTADVFHIGFVYEAEENTAGDEDKFYLGGKYMMGNNTLKAAWGSVDYDTSGMDDTDAWMIGLDHKMSKRTRAYVQYADSEHGLYQSNATGDVDGFSIGMQHKF